MINVHGRHFPHIYTSIQSAKRLYTLASVLPQVPLLGTARPPKLEVERRDDEARGQ